LVKNVLSGFFAELPKRLARPAKVLEEATVKLAVLQASEVASATESNVTPIQKVGTDDEC
jgi:hypothetical protein